MKRTRIVNMRDSNYDVYIGRGSKWGNPFKLGQDGTREVVVRKYKKWILKKPELMEMARRELKGKVLGCFCKPHRYHGDILVKIAEGRLG